jgi:alkaline phosphatase
MPALQQADTAQLKAVMCDLTGIDLSDEEYQMLAQYKNKKDSVVKIIQNHYCFGFTTHGHTGEEVFLAIYDPRGQQLTGHRTNIEVNRYLREAAGVENLEAETAAYFAKHTDVFKDYSYTITPGDKPVLNVTYKKNRMEIRPNTNIIQLNGKPVQLKTVVVYVDKNNTFYLPASLRELIAK